MQDQNNNEAGDSPAPMTVEQAIERRWQATRTSPPPVRQPVSIVLGEVERLRKVEQAARALVETPDGYSDHAEPEWENLETALGIAR